MIEIRQLQKNYQDFHLDCSLRVEDGMITGLAGKNGAGKSTTFKAILGLIRADGGEVIALARSLNNSGLKAFDVDLMGVIKFTCIGQHIIAFYIYCVFAFQSWFIVFHIRLPCFLF